MTGWGENDEEVWGVGDALVSDSANGFLGQANRGIAETAGGLVDLVNPFNDAAWANIAGGKFQTGSAVEGLKSGMGAIGADVANRPPEGVVEGMGRGAGNAAASIIPVAKALHAARGIGGVAGNVINDAYRALASVPGVAIEGAAGAVGGGAREVAKSAGAPEWAQNTAEMVAPALALPGAIAATGKFGRGAVNIASKFPVAGTAGRFAASAARDLKRGLVPMTDAGAREVAADRLRGLVGGEQRAGELSAGIDVDHDFNLTPAQQTGDPNLLGLERSAAAENPLLRERLAERKVGTQQAASDAISGMGGDVGDTRKFFDARLKTFKAEMNKSVEQAIQMADESVDGTKPHAAESTSSTNMVDRIKLAHAGQLDREGQLWAAVPNDATVPTEQARSTAQSLIDETPWAQRRDIPADLNEAFSQNGPLGDETTVAELHGLYSEMRRVARSAMAGTDQNRNRARIANAVADAILTDLGAVSATTPAGMAINEARTFSRALHETFDQGAVGRILKRTISTDEAISPDAALKRTVGRGGVEGKSDAASIQKASPEAGAEIQDYLRSRFRDSIVSPSGEFSPKSARTWLRNNRELLSRYPELRGELARAISSRSSADSFAARTAARVKLIEAKSAPARFNLGQEEKAVLSIIGADNPARTARSIVATANKDKSGRALAGVKAAFSDHLIGGSSKDGGLSGVQLKGLLADKNIKSAMQQVFSPKERSRLQVIARTMARMETAKVNDVGDVMNSPANRLVEMVVRIAAARHGGSIGGGSLGGSMQTANIAVERARSMLHNMTNGKARELLMDAIEDPALFKALMSEPKGVKLPKDIRNKLAPYLVGAVSNAGPE